MQFGEGARGEGRRVEALVVWLWGWGDRGVVAFDVPRSFLGATGGRKRCKLHDK